MSQEIGLSQINSAIENIAQAEIDQIWKEVNRDRSMMPMLLRLMVVTGVGATGFLGLSKMFGSLDKVPEVFVFGLSGSAENLIMGSADNCPETDTRQILDFGRDGLNMVGDEILFENYSLIPETQTRRLSFGSVDVDHVPEQLHSLISSDYLIDVYDNPELEMLEIVYNSRVVENIYETEKGVMLVDRSSGIVLLDTRLPDFQGYGVGYGIQVNVDTRKAVFVRSVDDGHGYTLVQRVLADMSTGEQEVMFTIPGDEIDVGNSEFVNENFFVYAYHNKKKGFIVNIFNTDNSALRTYQLGHSHVMSWVLDESAETLVLWQQDWNVGSNQRNILEVWSLGLDSDDFALESRAILDNIHYVSFCRSLNN